MRKVLVQLDPVTGKIINVWKNAVEATEKGFFEVVNKNGEIERKKFTRSGISNCTQGRIGHYRGFRWEYRYMSEEDIRKYRKKIN